MRPPRCSQSIAAITIALLALLFFWSQTVVFTYRIAQTGATVRRDDTTYTVLSVKPGSPAERAGLRRGDVVATDGSATDPANVLFTDEPVSPWRLRTVPLTVQRHSASHVLTVRPDSAPYPWSTRFRVIARLASFTAFVLIALWIVIARPNFMTWLLYVYGLTAVAPTGDWRSVIEATFGGTSWQASILTAIDMVFVRASFIALPLFVMRFPNDWPSGWRQRLWLPLASFAALYAIGSWIVAMFFWTEFNDDVIGWIDMAFQIFSIAALVATYLESTGIDRLRLKWGFIAVTAGIAADTGNEFSRVISRHSELGINIGTGFTILAVIMPVCLAYAIVRHEIIDVRFVLNRTAVYGIVFAVFAATFGLLDWLFTSYVVQSRFETAIAMLAAFALGFLFRNWRAPLVEAVDRTLFPRHYREMQILRQIRLRLEQQHDRNTVLRILMDDVARALQLTSAAVFAASSDGGYIRQFAIGWPAGTLWHLFEDDELARALERKRGKALRIADGYCEGLELPPPPETPVLALPVWARRKLLAVVVYGPHTSGMDIDPDEARAMTDLCSTAGELLQTYDRAAGIEHAAAAAMRPAR